MTISKDVLDELLKAFPVYVGSPIPCHAFGALGTLAIPLFQRKLETLCCPIPGNVPGDVETLN